MPDPHDDVLAARRRRDHLAQQLFTGLNVAVFLILIGCVGVAVVMWERWH